MSDLDELEQQARDGVEWWSLALCRDVALQVPALIARVRELEAAARVAAIETEERCIEEAKAGREAERERCLGVVQRVMGGWGWLDNALEIMAELDAAIVSASPTCARCGKVIRDGVVDFVTVRGSSMHTRCLP